MANEILVQFNTFGPPLRKEEIPSILDKKTENLFEEHRNETLEHFFGIPSAGFTEDLLLRFIEITDEESFTSIVPVIQPIVRPLVSAKRNYCFGDYPAAISSCGTAGEMMAIFLWRTANITLKGQPMTEEHETQLFGTTFEKLGQERRIDILIAMGTIDEKQSQKLNDIRGVRRRSLHYWEPSESEQKDALQITKIALGLAKDIADIQLGEGKIKSVSAFLLRWFDKQKMEPVEKPAPIRPASTQI